MSYKERVYSAYVTSGQSGKNVKVGSINFESNRPYIVNMIKRFLPANKSVRIYDLACGHGVYMYFLKQKGYFNIAGVDVSHEQINLARELGIVEAEQGTINEFLKSKNESVDVFLLMDILEHLHFEELFLLLDEICRKANENATVIIHVPNAEGIYGMRIRYGDVTHELCFSPKSIKQILSVIGFRVVSVYEDKPVVHGFVSFIRRCIWELGTLPHRVMLMAETGEKHFVLSQNMLVVARK
jgi:SAM-dependent methyltransferase